MPRIWRWFTALLFGLASAGATGASDFAERVSALNASSFNAKEAAARAVAATGHERAAIVLTAMLEGELHRQVATDKVVIAVRVERAHAVQDAVSGADLGSATRREVRRISVNNKLRRTLRGLIAGLRLDHGDAGERVAAARSIADSGDAQLRPLLDARRARENDAAVVEAIDTAMVVFDLDAEDEATRLAAIRASAGNLDGSVRIKLTDIAGDEGMSEPLRQAAGESLRTIERTVARYRMVETVFFGLSLGSILVLAAIGLSITFGVMGVINMAHGELIMLGAYTTYVIQTLMPGAIEYSLFVAVPAAFAVSGLVGVAIERGVIRFLYGRPWRRCSPPSGSASSCSRRCARFSRR